MSLGELMDLVVETPGAGRVEARRAQTRRQILDSAWRLATDAGLEALSLREIAASVGMQAPSLYSYFPRKAAILDALFTDGYLALDDHIAAVVAALPENATARTRLQALLRGWIGFCQADQARYRLLFTNAVPGWQPSEDAYSSSLANYSRVCDYLALAGITDPDDVDLCTALSAGLVAQQMANDPDGDRWIRRVDDVVDMFLQHLASRVRRADPLLKGTP
jgi:AcrR family transcriptional regulator